MKEGKDYEDYLVDKAKELLNEQVSEAGKGELDAPETPSGREGPGMERRNDLDTKADRESTSKIPFAWDPREVEHLARKRKEMDNQDLKDFLEKNTDFHDELEELDEWKGFTRWEERFMVQNFGNMETGEIAEELGRDEKEVDLKLKILGLKVE